MIRFILDRFLILFLARKERKDEAESVLDLYDIRDFLGGIRYRMQTPNRHHVEG